MIVPIMQPNRGLPLRFRSVETTMKSKIPGPGHYNPKPIQLNTLGPTFGIVGRENKSKEVYNDNSFNRSAILIKQNESGFSFTHSPRDSIVKTNNPGPGSYEFHLSSILPSPTLFSISSSINSSHVHFLTQKHPTCGVPFTNPKSSIANSGLQRFLKSDRFREPGRSQYKRKIFKVETTNKSMIEKNISSLDINKHDKKIQSIKNRNKRLNSLIKIANKKKQKIIDNWIFKVKLEYEEQNRKLLINKEKAKNYKIISSWLMQITINDWIKEIVRKYQLKRKVKKRTDKMMRILFITLQVVGKFCRKFYFLRRKKLMRAMTNFVSIKISYWKMKRRIRMKKIISKFFTEYSMTSQFHLFIMKIGRCLILVQRWYRRYLVKKRLMLAIMIIEWSHIEYAIVIKKILTKCKPQEWKNVINQHLESISVGAEISSVIVYDAL